MVQSIVRIAPAFRMWAGLILASLLLSGCVKYDVGVNFDSPHRGELIQHINLGERLTSFSGSTVQEWLDSIQRRAQQLQGKMQQVSSQEIIVTIPFNNGTELAAKFNEFFNPVVKKPGFTSKTTTEIPRIKSELSIKQNNFLLLIRNRLSCDLDLRPLALISTNGNTLISPGSIVDLEFILNTPWGAKSVETNPHAIPATTEQKGHHLVWTLQPGQENHLEAIFWLPSPIGIGTVVIVLFIALGIYLRYSFMPDPRMMRLS